MNHHIKKILNELQNFGERPILETPFEDVNPVLQFAYKWATKYAKDKSVLDYGCGGGYGTAYLARFTKQPVVGFDIDTSTIEKNTKFYSSVKNLSFITDKNKVGQYDLIVSFQVIEHIELPILRRIISDIKHRHLKKKGVFLVATVNKNITSYKLKKSVLPFHVHEFFPQELKELMEEQFDHVNVFGQMDAETQEKVKNGEQDYENMNYPFKLKVLRSISQNDFVRWVAQHTPLFLKNILTQTKQEDSKIEYELVSKKKLVDNSYIIMGECR